MPLATPSSEERSTGREATMGKPAIGLSPYEMPAASLPGWVRELRLSYVVSWNLLSVQSADHCIGQHLWLGALVGSAGNSHIRESRDMTR